MTRLHRYYAPVRLPPDPPPSAVSKSRPPIGRVSLDYPHHPSSVPCPIPRQTEQVRMSVASLFARPSPGKRRVGVCIDSFEACSDFTRVTARWIAQPPEAAFVTRLRPDRLLAQAARQLPDQSTTLWVEPSSTGDTRLRGALFPASYPRSPCGASHFTDCASTIARVGLASRPDFSRSLITR
jgi:hypothetical protein